MHLVRVFHIRRKQAICTPPAGDTSAESASPNPPARSAGARSWHRIPGLDLRGDQLGVLFLDVGPGSGIESQAVPRPAHVLRQPPAMAQISPGCSGILTKRRSVFSLRSGTYIKRCIAAYRHSAICVCAPNLLRVLPGRWDRRLTATH